MKVVTVKHGTVTSNLRIKVAVQHGKENITQVSLALERVSHAFYKSFMCF